MSRYLAKTKLTERPGRLIGVPITLLGEKSAYGTARSPYLAEVKLADRRGKLLYATVSPLGGMSRCLAKTKLTERPGRLPRPRSAPCPPRQALLPPRRQTPSRIGWHLSCSHLLPLLGATITSNPIFGRSRRPKRAYLQLSGGTSPSRHCQRALPHVWPRPTEWTCRLSRWSCARTSCRASPAEWSGGPRYSLPSPGPPCTR